MEKTVTLKKNYEFKRILTKGKYFSGKYLDIYVMKSNDTKNRIGIAIGVKLTNAVNRNRLKRLIRENYREIEQELNLGYSIVFLWKKKVDISYATYSNIKEDMQSVFRRIGILK